MTENKNNKSLLSDLLPIIIGEIIVAVLTCVGFILLKLVGIYTTDLGKVAMGAMLGAMIIVVNHGWLSLTVDREIKKYLEIRGNKEMSEEEADLFTKKHSTAIQNAIKISSVIRTVLMLATLLIAFLTGWFNPIAAAIPMFAMRFVLMATELIKSKNNPKPDPAKFIKYEDADENTDDKKEDN
jgi:hypothetical protein